MGVKEMETEATYKLMLYGMPGLVALLGIMLVIFPRTVWYAGAFGAVAILIFGTVLVAVSKVMKETLSIASKDDPRYLEFVFRESLIEEWGWSLLYAGAALLVLGILFGFFRSRRAHSNRP